MMTQVEKVVIAKYGATITANKQRNCLLKLCLLYTSDAADDDYTV